MTTEAKTTEARGNINARAFFLTLNQPERIDELLKGLTSYKTCDYIMVSCLEKAKTTGHLHYHIYVHFDKPLKKLNRKKTADADIERVKGTYKSCRNYFTKQGPLYCEIGTPPHQGQKTVGELKELNVEDVPPQYYRIKREIDAREQDENNFFDMLGEIERDELKAPKIIYITGGTGKGKTYKAYKIALQNYPKNEIGKITLKNDFFDIINENANCYVIEEFRPSQIKASDFLQLTDKYGYRANIKGGFVSLRPEMLIICSIKPPEEIYKDEVNEQFLRRITQRIDLNDTDPDATA